MNGSLLLVMVAISSAFVFDESQRCTTSDDCEKNGCCENGSCTYREATKILCRWFNEGLCHDDWDCTDGCCTGKKCHSKSSYQCIHKKCNFNSDCDSDCCKYGRCQKTNAPCLKPVTFTTPTFRVSTIDVIFLNKCSYNFDCYSSAKGRCCVDGRCGECPDDYPRVARLLWAQQLVGVIAGIIISACCMSCCVGCSKRKRLADTQNVLELQREHEQAQQRRRKNRRPPPPYSQQDTHRGDGTQDVEQNPSLAEHGVTQDSLLEPPLMYTRMVNPSKNANKRPVQSALETSSTEGMNGETGITIEPPPAYSPIQN